MLLEIYPHIPYLFASAWWRKMDSLSLEDVIATAEDILKSTPVPNIIRDETLPRLERRALSDLLNGIPVVSAVRIRGGHGDRGH